MDEQRPPWYMNDDKIRRLLATYMALVVIGLLIVVIASQLGWT